MKNKNSKRHPDQIKNERRPWLDPDGKPYCDSALREISKGWDQKQWEKFLAKTVDCHTQEALPSLGEYDKACEDNFETIFEQHIGQKRPAPNEIQNLLRTLIRKHLTLQQAKILNQIYWEDRSNRETAKVLGIDEKQVRVQRTRSLKKLKVLLEKHTRIFTYSEGQRRFLAEFFTPIEAPQTRDEQILEVYREDCQMRFFKC